MHKLTKQLALLGFFPFSFFSYAHTIKTVVSFSILADIVGNIGGNHISVTTLVGPNANIHTYEPTPSDAQIIKQADIIFINGLHLENFIDRLIKASGTKAPLIEASTSIIPLKAKNHTHNAHHHSESSLDPHAWQSITNVKTYVKNIATALCKIDQKSCKNYNKNADDYIQKLDTKQKAIMAQIATIPEKKRTIITSHDSFNYFAHEYDFTVLSPESVSTEIEATAADVAKLIRQIKDKNVSAVFVENISNPRLIKQISRETGLTIGGILYSDALSEKNGPAATYIDMIQHNIDTIINSITKNQST
ncbi:metal ABC transporter solute-binding protein, Zn/Mn family [Bartonella ancashensis]|uniref:Zinc ABC transporter, periplasmic-binding protein ZnuA n=1 Tax=Bartonella ancashensis TaxID=1318743 RepID=A0A0M4LKR3_9HYPH|nr:zinc ABC transporter substrate-binding protein [Bartonella ancashensis]ALE04114.1 Zinc ABC transporter, periplasmic-binding protein ZnuA [Bartonella ancashensis]